MTTRTTCTKKNSWEWFVPINDYKNDLYQKKLLRVVYTNKWLQERLVPKNSWVVYTNKWLQERFVPKNSWEWFMPMNDYKNDLYQKKILRVVYTNKWLQERLVPKNSWEWFIPINDYKNGLYQKTLESDLYQ